MSREMYRVLLTDMELNWLEYFYDWDPATCYLIPGSTVFEFARLPSNVRYATLDHCFVTNLL